MRDMQDPTTVGQLWTTRPEHLPGDGHHSQTGIWGLGMGVGLLSLGIFWLPGAPPAIAQGSTSTSPPAIATSPQRVSRPTLRLGSEGRSVSELQAMLTLMGYYQGTVDGLYQDSTQAAVVQFQQAAGLEADGIVGPATWNHLFPEPPNAVVPPEPPMDSSHNQGTNAPPSSSPPATVANPPSPTTPPPSSGQDRTPESNAPESNAPESNASENGTPENSTPESTPVDLPILRRGMYGPAIVRLQERLTALSFYQGALDGIFGPATEAAVQDAQRHYQISPDGIVGPATWGALLR